MPETSIIVRTYNEAKHIGNFLRAMEKQDYKDYEVIIVDSSSTDETLEIAQKFPVKIAKIESRDFTFGYALNVGCRMSKGRYLVCASAHVAPVSESWLSHLIAPLDSEKVAMVYGRQTGNHESKFSEKRDFQKLFGNSALDSEVPLSYANNANSAIKKELWEERPFDEYLFGLEDIDWAKHMTKKGFLVHYEPKAAVYHIHTEEWHQVFNRYRREAIAAFRIGLDRPAQAGIDFFWPVKSLLGDIISSFPNWSRRRLEEIVRFRYYQWKGSRQGWFRDRELDLNREKYNFYFPPTSQSVVIEGKGKAKFKEVPIPEIRPGYVLIKVDYVGVCRTDLEVYEGTLGYYRDGLASYPIVPGHEFSGVIVKMGANNKYRERFKVGERVVGECILSRGGDSDRKEVGVVNYNGAYSQFVVMPGDFIHKIPEGLDMETAVLAEPFAVVLRALRRLGKRLDHNSSVAVLGAGPIGNLCAQYLSLEGYGVTVFDKNNERLKLLESKVEKVSTTLLDLGRFNIIIEVTGSREVLAQIMKESRIDSTVLLLGFPYGDMKYNFEDIVGKEKVIFGSVGAEWEDFQLSLETLPQIDTSYFTQTIIPLKDFKKAWELQKTSKYLKILLKP